MKKSEMLLILRHWIQHCIYLEKTNQFTSDKIDQVSNKILTAMKLEPEEDSSFEISSKSYQDWKKSNK